MSLRHVVGRRGTERLAEHRDEARHTLITEVGGDLLDGGAAGQPLHRQHDAKSLPPATEGHPRFLADEAQQAALTHACALGPDIESTARYDTIHAYGDTPRTPSCSSERPAVDTGGASGRPGSPVRGWVTFGRTDAIPRFERGDSAAVEEAVRSRSASRGFSGTRQTRSSRVFSGSRWPWCARAPPHIGLTDSGAREPPAT